MFDLIINLSLLTFFSFLLIKSTEILILALNRLCQSSKISHFGLANFLMGLTTSLPEFFIAIVSALEKNSHLSLGNILGANIANLSLVAGGAALVAGSIGISGDFYLKDVLYVFSSGILPLLLLLDNKLTQVEGLFLLLIYGVYNYTLLKPKGIGKIRLESGTRRFLRRINSRKEESQLAWFFLGAALLIFSADGLVKSAVLVAQNFQVPLLLVGLFLVSVGTTLPELSFEIYAARKKQVGMVFGNLMGSIIANSTLILGLAALINPIKLNGNFEVYFLATFIFLLVFSLFWLFVRTKRKLERWEAVILLLVYFVFIFLEFWRASNKPTLGKI